MDYHRPDDSGYLRIIILRRVGQIRELGTHNLVDNFRIKEVGVVEEYQKVEVGKSTFLIFHGPDPGNAFAEDTVLENVVQHLLFLQAKDPRCQIRPIRCLLAGEQFALHLVPFRIGGHGDKLMRLPIVAGKCHGIVIGLRMKRSLLTCEDGKTMRRPGAGVSALVSGLGGEISEAAKLSANPWYRSARVLFWLFRIQASRFWSTQAMASTTYC
jgi:hypothetical protein